MAWRDKFTHEDKMKYFIAEMKRRHFCKTNNIESAYTTYFRFKANGIYYAVVSNSLLYRYFNQTKGKEDSEDCRIDVVIWASKQRLEEIWKNAMDGKVMDEKGRVINDKTTKK